MGERMKCQGNIESKIGLLIFPISLFTADLSLSENGFRGASRLVCTTADDLFVQHNHFTRNQAQVAKVDHS